MLADCNRHDGTPSRSLLGNRSASLGELRCFLLARVGSELFLRGVFVRIAFLASHLPVPARLAASDLILHHREAEWNVNWIVAARFARVVNGDRREVNLF